MHLLGLEGFCQVELLFLSICVWFPLTLLLVILFYRHCIDLGASELFDDFIVLVNNTGGFIVVVLYMLGCRHKVVDPNFVVSLLINAIADPLKGLEHDERNFRGQESVSLIQGYIWLWRLFVAIVIFTLWFDFKFFFQYFLKLSLLLLERFDVIDDFFGLLVHIEVELVLHELEVAVCLVHLIILGILLWP